MSTLARNENSGQKKDPYNQLQYLKGMYENNSNNPQQQRWARNEAKSWYDMLDDDNERTKVQNMDSKALGAYRNTMNQNQPQTSSTSTSTPSTSNAPASQTPEGNDPYNEVMYWKGVYENADNDDTRKYASRQAEKWYDMLPANERQRVKSMNQSQLGEYRSSKDSENVVDPETGEVTERGGVYTPPEEEPYKPPVEQIDFDKWRTENATIEDLQEQYGFDYSRDYAARQAEAEAQAKQDGIANQRRQTEANVDSAAENLDRNYFQEALQQMQQQTNAGLNAGIASDQDLRMAMNRQNAMGDIYRDRNVNLADLSAQEARVELERLAREDSLFNERLQEGFDNSMALTDSDRQNNQQMIDALLQGREQDIGQYEFGKEFALEEGKLQGRYMTDEQQEIFDQIAELKRLAENTADPVERANLSRQADTLREQAVSAGIDPALIGSDVSYDQMMQNMQNFSRTIDSQLLDEDARQFDQELAEQRRQYDSVSGNVNAELAQRQRERSSLSAYEEATLRWDREKFFAELGWERSKYNNLSAAEKAEMDLLWAQFEGLSAAQKAEFGLQNERLQWQKEQFATEQAWREHTYNNMSAAEQRQFDIQVDQFGQEMAWTMHEFQANMEFNAASAGAGYEGDYYTGAGGTGGGSGNPGPDSQPPVERQVP